jgi:hypothetical protein
MRTEEYYATIELNNLTLDIVVTANLYPAEPMVRYYSNGDGYPGADTYCELVSVWVYRVEGDFGSRKRDQGDGWFKDLDRLADDYVGKHSEEFENKIFESIENEDY